ncbi:MAG: D-alanyl-D-alanine carboxypeptidase [Candidatus Sumerlaeia bacterium]|nr:D-alanyl-D-alanine carboxypeptidase [Candidatus Sumerlaeia bacterium]
MKMSNKPFTARLATAVAALSLVTTSSYAITLAQLQSNINAVINNSDANVQWSVKIENNAGNGDFFAKNNTTMRRPASNTKIFTTAAAFRKFGPNYVWQGSALGSSSTTSPVDAILSDSDNTLADSLFSTVGGQSAALAEIGAITSTTGMVMLDGSGLNYDNRFNCEQTIDVVRWATNTYTYSQWASHMAISCTSGTLGSRLCGTGQVGRVHAKTGTLTNGGTLSLSGYVDNQYDGKRYFFSIYTNNIPSAAQSDTRSRIDTIVSYMCQSGLPSVDPAPVEVIVDNAGTEVIIPSTSWFPGTSIAGYYGSNYHARATASVSDAFTFRGTIPSDGNYQIFARWTAATNRASAAPFIINHTGGSTTVNVNQQINNGTWVSLGTYNLYQGSTADRVKVSCWTTPGFYVVADAIRFVKQ